MPSDVEICNLALVKVGSERIASLLDESKQAKILNAIYNQKKDAELAANHWTFATKRASIPASSTAPAFGWKYAYPLPSDFLRMIQVGDNYSFYDSGDGAIFSIEGKSILTNEPAPLKIRYIYRVENSGILPALFVEVLAARLHIEIVEALSQSASKADVAMNGYKMALRAARKANAIEMPPQMVPDHSWTRELRGI
jgi:hypothetical protein